MTFLSLCYRPVFTCSCIHISDIALQGLVQLPGRASKWQQAQVCCGQVIMQRRGMGWVPDFLFSESTFQPLAPCGDGNGAARNAAALTEALAGARRVAPFDDSPSAAQPHAHQLARVVALLLDRCAPSRPFEGVRFHDQLLTVVRYASVLQVEVKQGLSCQCPTLNVLKRG